MPRDRNGDYEPQIVKKHQTDVSEIEDKILFLYSQGTSTRDIERTMQEMYGIEVDGLTGFSEAIAAAYPKTEIQRCIIHQIRSSTRYVSYKDVKAFTSALKPVYKAPTEKLALEALDELESAWGAKYPASIKSWRDHWDELATMYKYTEQIRRSGQCDAMKHTTTIRNRKGTLRDRV